MENISRSELEDFKRDLLKEIKELINHKENNTPKKFLKSKEVRELLNISSTKLYELRRDGKIPMIKVGGTYLYPFNEIINSFNKEDK